MKIPHTPISLDELLFNVPDEFKIRHVLMVHERYCTPTPPTLQQLADRYGTSAPSVCTQITAALRRMRTPEGKAFARGLPEGTALRVAILGEKSSPGAPKKPEPHPNPWDDAVSTLRALDLGPVPMGALTRWARSQKFPLTNPDNKIRRQARLISLESLARMPEQELLAIPGVGRGTVQRIKEATHSRA